MTASKSTPFGLNEIGQIAVPVRDIKKAVQFYNEVLGMTLLFQAPPGLAFFDCGGVRLMLDAPAAKQAGNASVLYYKVPDIHLAHEELSHRCVQFEKGPHAIAKLIDHELWMAFFRDPDGNLLALMSEVPLT